MRKEKGTHGYYSTYSPVGLWCLYHLPHFWICTEHSGVCTLWTTHWCQLYPGSDECKLWADRICNFLWGASQWIYFLNCTPHKGTVSLSSIWYCCLWYNRCYRCYQPGFLCSLFCIWHLACSDMDNRVAAMVNRATMSMSHPLVTLHPPTGSYSQVPRQYRQQSSSYGLQRHSTRPPQEHPTPIYKQESGGCSWTEENWRMSDLVNLGRGKGRFDCGSMSRGGKGGRWTRMVAREWGGFNELGGPMDEGQDLDLGPL